MSLSTLASLTAAALIVAYFTYGRLLAKLLRLDSTRLTPAVELRDDVDFEPIEPKFLLSQHFSAIAAAGPIIGPITAGKLYGWLPALLWILVGSIFIGGVHDFTALVASIRHRARSIADVVREHMSRRAYFLFLAFVWLSLVYIIVAFTDVTAGSFVNPDPQGEAVATKPVAGDDVSGPGIASSSLMYLFLPIAMGFALRYTKLSLNLATMIFLPLVGASIFLGQKYPLSLDFLPNFGCSDRQVWCVILLIYCVVASVAPVWMLLQPRGHLGGYFLYAVLIVGLLGIFFGGESIEYPAIKPANDVKPLMPMLFITIACGACSGFHSIIASGTTSKQLRNEYDAKPVAYGAMLMEAMVAFISLACVMRLAVDSPTLGRDANFLYADGIAEFLERTLRVPKSFGLPFGMLAFTTFVYDTLDVCTRLGRYVLQELTGWKSQAGRWITTIATAAAPIPFLLMPPTVVGGRKQHVFMIFWELFGASNQLLAALTLLGVTVWLWNTYRKTWVFYLVGIPTAWMYLVSMTALLRMSTPLLKLGRESIGSPIPFVAALLASLGILLLVEAALIAFRNRPGAGLGPTLKSEGESATMRTA